MRQIKSIGFAGTSDAMSRAQIDSLLYLVRALYERFNFLEAHHGDCIEADAAFDCIIKIRIDPKVELHIHPGIKGNGTFHKRAFCKPRQNDIVYEPHPFLERNEHIVAAADALVAVPDTDEEVTRRGEWATVRYARKKHIPIFIVWPDGTIKMDRDEHLDVFNHVFQNVPTICK